jgi:hypothetical protein
MSDSIIAPVKELPEEARQTIEGLLERPLGPDERISIRAWPKNRRAPQGKERQQAAARLSKTLSPIYERARQIPKAELEQLLDEVTGDGPIDPK